MKTITILMLVLASFTGSAQAIDELDVANYINSREILHKEIVMAQCLLETGNLRCTGCSMDNDNNLFGFFYKGAYIEFDTWQESVDYYEWWQGKLYHGGDYYVFLKNIGFATADGYIKELKRFNLKFEYDE